MENPNIPTQPKPPRPWQPQTRIGKKALIFGIITIAWGVLLIPLGTFIHAVLHIPVAGFVGLLLEVVLIIFCLIYSIRAIFGKVKDRSYLNLIIFITFCVVGGFWIMMLVGEIAFPH